MSYESDVIGKPVTSKETNNGGKVVYSGFPGGYKVRESEKGKVVSTAGVLAKLDTRFAKNQ